MLAAGTSVWVVDKNNRMKYPSPKEVELVCYGKSFLRWDDG